MSIIAMTPVKSSQISAMGHCPVQQVLRVVFKNGSTYTYQQVPKNVYDNLMAAESVGKAFSSSIKAFPTQYPFVQEAA